MSPPGVGDREIRDWMGDPRPMSDDERAWFGDRADREHVGPYDETVADVWGAIAEMWSDLGAMFASAGERTVDDLANLGPGPVLDHEAPGRSR